MSERRCWAIPRCACLVSTDHSVHAMKSSIVRYAVIGMVLIGLAAGALMWRPSISAVASPTVAHDRATLARGARVVAQGDCIVCHTAEGGSAYAGGLALKTPFGAIYSTNITPDAQTGIGRWSVEAFRRALRNGISRDGHWLYPAFPYVHYTHLADADIDDVYAYMMSRTPVHAVAPKNGLPLLFQFRPSLAFWNLLYL